MSEPRPTPDALLARITERERPRLRIYIGAAPGVGKTYEMLQEAHALRARSVDVVVGFVETYGRRDTEAQLKDLEVIPRRQIEYRGVTLEDMDVDAIVGRRPQVVVVDELAHTNVPGSRNAKRYEDVLEILGAGIAVMTAVNIQHLETLNDAVAKATGVRVRETVPDTFLDRADEVINVDVTVEELRSRLREGKIYRPEKVEQALTNFFRKGNLSTLRELALRAVADEVGEKAASYRAREGLEPALIPERVMVCMSSNALAPRVIRTGARIAGRLGSKWYAVYVETPREQPGRIGSRDAEALRENIRLAESLGATVVRVKAARPADGLIAFAQREGVTHVIFGQTADASVAVAIDTDSSSAPSPTRPSRLSSPRPEHLVLPSGQIAALSRERSPQAAALTLPGVGWCSAHRGRDCCVRCQHAAAPAVGGRGGQSGRQLASRRRVEPGRLADTDDASAASRAGGGTALEAARATIDAPAGSHALNYAPDANCSPLEASSRDTASWTAPRPAVEHEPQGPAPSSPAHEAAEAFRRALEAAVQPSELATIGRPPPLLRERTAWEIQVRRTSPTRATP
jgi:two-component system sensor histidine kinase KdpD